MSDYQRHNKWKVYQEGRKVGTIFVRALQTSEIGQIEQLIHNICKDSGKQENEVIYAAWKIALENLEKESIEYLERQHFQPNTPEWRRLEQAKLDHKIRMRNDRVANISYYKHLLDPEEFEYEAQRLGWDLEEFNKHYQAKPAPAKKFSELSREFLERYFQDKTVAPVDDIKIAAVDEGLCSWIDDEKKQLDGWDALRMVAQREGYIGKEKGIWSDPLKRVSGSGVVQ